MSGTSEADAHELQARADELVSSIEIALPGWVVECVRTRCAQAGIDFGSATEAAARRAGKEAASDVVPRLRTLVDTDVDAQRSNPLTLLRVATRYPTEVLETAGVDSVGRDRRDRELFPDDRYDLGPAAFADLGPDVHEAGIWVKMRQIMFTKYLRSIDLF